MTTEGDTPEYRGTLYRPTAELLAWHAGAPAEEALEPELPILDAHHHLYGTPADSSYYRLGDLERDFGGGHRIVGTVYVEAYQAGWYPDGPEHLRPVGEVARIVDLTAAPVRGSRGAACQVAAGIVAYADLTRGDAVADVLEAELAAGQGRLRGVRHPAAYDGGQIARFVKSMNRPRMLADATFRKGVAQLGRLGLSFDAWVHHTQLGDVAGLADAFPGLAIVLNHVGGLIGVAEYRADRAGNVARWRQGLRELAARPNVYVKIGGLGMPLFGFGFEHRERPASSAELAQAWGPLIDACIEAFGPARCMFEGNFPVDKQTCGYTALWNAFKLATRSLSAGERADLFFGTACRAYRLPVDRLLDAE
ncbi:amidohydrolase family protein [Pigmentiphaga soli]|uniref:Amidohydrolase family protein n=1 Tax=Pigmentiphaga soli TaxID=1007095 RepID=A0ABP8GTT0_9BURK